MVPIILLSSTRLTATSYIKKLVKDMKVSPGYVTVVEKDGASVKIEQIRKLSELFFRSNTNTRVIVIRDFETARNETQNAMLKILEEKTSNVQFVITCSDQSAILPTIASRCKIIKLASVSTNNEMVDLGKCFSEIFPTTDKIKSEKIITYIDQFVLHSRAQLKHSVESNDVEFSRKYLKFIKDCLECRYLLNHNNLNAQMVIDHLLLRSLTLRSEMK